MRTRLLLAVLVVAGLLVPSLALAQGGGVPISLGSGGHTVENEGTPLTPRTSLNFVGTSINCADAGGKTVCTITPDVVSGVLSTASVLAIPETSSAPSTATGYGKLWIKNGTGDTNQLHLLQGDGNDDIVLRLAGAGGTGHAQGVVFMRETGTGGAGTDTIFKYDYTNGYVNIPAAYLSTSNAAAGSNGGGGVFLFAGADPPSTCSVGDIFFEQDTSSDTDCTTAFNGAICRCTASNTWTPEASLTANMTSSGSWSGTGALPVTADGATFTDSGAIIGSTSYLPSTSGAGSILRFREKSDASGGSVQYISVTGTGAYNLTSNIVLPLRAIPRSVTASTASTTARGPVIGAVANSGSLTTAEELCNLQYSESSYDGADSPAFASACVAGSAKKYGTSTPADNTVDLIACGDEVDSGVYFEAVCTVE